MTINCTVGKLENGDAGDYSTREAAESAMAAGGGDTATVWYADNLHSHIWDSNFVIAKPNTWIGALSRQRITWAYTGGSHCVRVTCTGAEIRNICAASGIGAYWSIYVDLTGVSSGTLTFLNCLILDAAYGAYLYLDGAATVNMVNCLVHRAQGYGFCKGGAAGTVNLVHCGVQEIPEGSFGYRNISGTMNCYNCYSGPGGGGWYSGTYGGDHNASYDATNPGASGVTLDITSNLAHFWREENEYETPFDARITTASALYHAGGDQTAYTSDLDMWGNARHASTPSIGPFEGQDCPTHPSAANIADGVTCILIDGTTRTGTADVEAHTADEVLKSAGGNWNDDDLGVGDEANVADGVAFGLSQTGTGELEAHVASDVVSTSGGTWDVTDVTAANLLVGATAGVAGAIVGEAIEETHSDDEVLKSAGGNYNDDNLSVANVRPVAFGLSLTGTLAGLLATDSAYVSLENSRNNDNGTVAGDIASGKSVKIRNTTIDGAEDVPSLNSVLTTDTLRGVAGNWDASNLTEAKVAEGTDFGLSQTGTLSGSTLTVSIPAPVPVQLGTTETTIYECPAGKSASVKSLRIVNTDSSARTVTIYKVLSGDSAADDVALLKGRSFAASGSLGDSDEFGPYTLNAGDKLSGLASVASKITVTPEPVELEL